MSKRIFVLKVDRDTKGLDLLTRVCVFVCFYLSSQEYKDSHTVRQESWFYVAKL